MRFAFLNEVDDVSSDVCAVSLSYVMSLPVGGGFDKSLTLFMNVCF